MQVKMVCLFRLTKKRASGIAFLPYTSLKMATENSFTLSYLLLTSAANAAFLQNLLNINEKIITVFKSRSKRSGRNVIIGWNDDHKCQANGWYLSLTKPVQYVILNIRLHHNGRPFIARSIHALRLYFEESYSFINSILNLQLVEIFHFLQRTKVYLNTFGMNKNST